MKEPKESNRSLREKIEAHPFELPANSWEQMADILDGKKPVPQPTPAEDRRRPGMLWILLSGLLLTAVYLSAHGLWKPGVQAFPVPLAAPAQVEVGAGEPSSERLAAEEREEATEMTTTENPIIGAASTAKPTESGTPERRALSGGNSSGALPPLPAKAATEPSPPAMKTLPVLPQHADVDSQAVAAIGKDLPGPELYPLQQKVLLVKAIPTIDPAPLFTATPTAEMEEIPARRPSPWSFGLKAGTDIQTQQATGLIGGFVAYQIAPRWSIQLEPQFKLRSDNIGQGLELLAVKADTLYTPSFASASQSAERITRIHFWELPLTVHYQLGPRWQLLAGAQLVHVRNFSQQDVQQLRSNADQAVLESNSFSTSRPSANLRKWDAGLLAGVEYRLTPALSLDLRYVQGLYELTRSTYFTREADYFNSSVQLSIKWRCCD